MSKHQRRIVTYRGVTGCEESGSGERVEGDKPRTADREKAHRETGIASLTYPEDIAESDTAEQLSQPSPELEQAIADGPEAIRSYIAKRAARSVDTAFRVQDQVMVAPRRHAQVQLSAVKQTIDCALLEPKQVAKVAGSPEQARDTVLKLVDRQRVLSEIDRAIASGE